MKKDNKKSRKSILLLIGVFAIVIIASLFIFLGDSVQEGIERKQAQVTIESVDIELYKSRGVRDTNKQLQDNFILQDPIQAKILFADAQEGSRIFYRFRNQERVIQELDLPLQGSGERFITVTPTARSIESGQYSIDVVHKYMNKDNEEKEFVLATKSFRIE